MITRRDLLEAIEKCQGQKKLLFHVIMTLKRRYKVDLTKIIRQADVTGEPNPKYFWIAVNGMTG